MIPEGWITKRFADVADYKAGRTPARATSEYWTESDDGVPWVTISDMAEFGIITRSKERVTNAAFEAIFGRKIVPSGTLVMSFKLTIGRTATLGIDACHNEAIISIFPREGIDQRYLGYSLAQVDYAALQDRQVKGNTLNREKIDRIQVLLPPITEQRSIADVLDLVKHSVSLQEMALATAQELQHAAMRTLFAHGLRGEAQKETEIGKVPESWEETTLGDLCRGHGGALQTGPFGSQLHKDDYQETGVAVVNPTHMDAGRIAHDNVPHINEENARRLQRHRLEDSDILFARRGEIGRQALVTKLEEGWLCGTGCFLARVRSISVDNRFLSYQFSTAASASWLRTHAAGAIMPNLNNVVLGRLPVFYPSVSEQREIVAILDAIDRKIDLHRRKRAVLDDLFKALLHKLMTGEIRIADLDLRYD